MQAEILSVGTEILLGDITNTNAAFLARELAELGVNCFYQTAVGDNPSRLRHALDIAFSRADLVITTGGLGPTQDDLTKETVAKYLGVPLVFHEPSWEHVKTIMATRNREPQESQKRDALMPVGARVLPNGNGTANGVWLEAKLDGTNPMAATGADRAIAGGQACAVGNKKIVIMLPGPPREMKALFSTQVKPLLEKQSGGVLVSRNLRLFGIGESIVENQLAPGLIDGANPTVALYAGDHEVRLRVSAKAETAQAAANLVDPLVTQLAEQFSQYVYAIDTPSLEYAVVETLKAKGLKVATAESCTGGLVASRLTSISGSSDVFGYGIVSYANSAKQELLGVRGSTLAQYGAVSEETAIEMAEGVKNVSGADIGVAITGIAGPDGGTMEKPVGLVWLAIASRNGVRTKELRLSRGYQDERIFIQSFAATNALYETLREAESLN